MLDVYVPPQLCVLRSVGGGEGVNIQGEGGYIYRGGKVCMYLGSFASLCIPCPSLFYYVLRQTRRGRDLTYTSIYNQTKKERKGVMVRVR